jgi:hypothetical protein
LSCIEYLQLIKFIHCECYWTRCKSCKNCNSPYIHCNSLQLSHNNSFSTTMQFPHDYNHNVMLRSFFIHPSKFNIWHYEKNLWFFWNIDVHCPLWLFVLNNLGLWHMAQSKVVMWHINWILENNNNNNYYYIYIYIHIGRSVHNHRSVSSYSSNLLTYVPIYLTTYLLFR